MSSITGHDLPTSNEDELKRAQEDINAEIAKVAPDQRPPFSCRIGVHSYVYIDIADSEHEELCRLLCRARAQMNAPAQLVDRVCIACGHLDPRLQRFLIALRRVRSLGKQK